MRGPGARTKAGERDGDGDGDGTKSGVVLCTVGWLVRVGVDMWDRDLSLGLVGGGVVTGLKGREEEGGGRAGGGGGCGGGGGGVEESRADVYAGESGRSQLVEGRAE